ncbi:sister chromatid cohesion 1 protein 2 isoform X2 [Cicer arietinum]|uniref:Sister chromatid cohesion 1 protein 2 isoform X2 n=1 Tax=Cicer arietinum TaxID=3827 RepID=A0A3Q7WW99_CICAR|nr:sister chromatid cohesion 1 protein 2 isoform X2 [Cicer arietinum]
MVKSKGLCSSRSPLWVAAFCFKQLKKAQILDTDISSSVDKIMHREMDAVSYRVLAFLLLGVVKIHSKKVEYFLNYCNAALVRINKFLIKNAPVERMCMSITIPDRFELDALDLGTIFEDTDECHIAPPELITLKEVLPETRGFMQFSQEKFEDFGIGESSCSVDHLMTENVHRNLDFDVLPARSSFNESKQAENEHNLAMESLRSLHAMPNEIVDVDGAENFQEFIERSQDDESHKKVSVHHEKSPVFEESLEEHSEGSIEEFNMAMETVRSFCEMHNEIVAIDGAGSFREIIERTQDDESYRKESVHSEKSCVVEESLNELVQGSLEEHDKERNLEFGKKVSLEDEKSSVIPSESTIIDVTPQSKFQGGSIGRPKSGATTLEFRLIPTPAETESARSSKKRKIIIDKKTVLSDKVLRKHINDASDLISVRKPLHSALLDKRRKFHMSSLLDEFNQSLFPCFSPKLESLFSNKKLKLPDSFEIVETQQNSESQTVGTAEHIEIAPRRPDSLGNLEIHERLDRIETGPETPPLCSKVKVRSVKDLENTEIQNSDIEHSNLHESIEREPSLERSDNMMEELNEETSNSYETLEKEQCLNMDDDLNLMNEEINSSETNNSKWAGWSERTRKVASYLQKSFQDQGKQKGEDIVNFSQVSEGRTRKESARLFYEVLVLKTTNYVDVQQNNAYGDIAVRKLKKFDQTFGVDSMLN